MDTNLERQLWVPAVVTDHLPRYGNLLRKEVIDRYLAVVTDQIPRYGNLERKQ